MTWNPTNANDVTLIVSQVQRDDSGTRTGATELANTNSVVVDDFSIETAEDMEALSGVGNSVPQGVSKGNIEYSFEFTIQGEDAEVFTGLVNDDDGRAQELEIIALFEAYRDKLTGCWSGTRNLSGSSGDTTEYQVEGLATGRDPGTQ